MSLTSDEAENELIAQCRKGDRAAQKKLYDQYKKAMFTKAFRIVNNMDHAHDVLQEAFLEVFKDIGQFRGNSTLGAWIKTIVIRKALRKQRIEIKYESIHEIQHGEPAEWPDTLSGEQLHKAIQALPAGYRAVFTLIEIEGYSHKEVSTLLHISEGTSKSQLYHSKKMLQKMLKSIYQ
ncbi:RNA polymerase sigma factor [Rhodocytophaga aerolata]|uniref:RNA polymerase sigma factor n=1 Tax=Rhodocytophaga aerolata TaxID=455078 RepID=A0ABT8R637_9BACT|nr:RNA polymerase sigma factor [Rhodocytophaga aerolata]MDO1447116.1 RNA polymerase sigma factor [Rhodocytophaga aerolata]